MSEVTEREPDLSQTYEVQARNTTDGHALSGTELARIVAAYHGWRFAQSDELIDASDEMIAPSIEAAARAMRALGWFTPGATGVMWSRIDERAATAVRIWLRGD